MMGPFETSNHQSADNGDEEPPHDLGAIVDALARQNVPLDAVALNNRGAALFAERKWREAIAEYDRALAIDPEFAAAFFNRAVARFAVGELHGALADCSQAITLKPTYAHAWETRGVIRRDLSDLHGAVADFTEALRLGPRSLETLNNRGVVYHHLGKLKRALADFDEALRTDPQNKVAQYNREAVRADLDARAGTQVDCLRDMALAPPTAHARRGMALQKQQKWADALVEYGLALELDPGLYWVYILRGHTRYHCGDWQGLCDDYARAFAIHAEQAAAVVLRSFFPGLNASAAAELRACDEHLRKNPDDPISYARRGFIRLLMRQEAGAQEDFARCRSLLPTSAAYLDKVLQHARRLAQGWRR
jgi:tetratricopeptide (TPR) repeat protein